MIIIGHKALKSPKFRAIRSISDIDKTFANEVVFLAIVLKSQGIAMNVKSLMLWRFVALWI